MRGGGGVMIMCFGRVGDLTTANLLFFFFFFFKGLFKTISKGFLSIQLLVLSYFW